MEQEWRDLLARFGQAVTLRGAGVDSTLRALIQPVLDRGRDQEISTPLGVGRQERLLYLGPAEQPLGPDTLVEWKGKEYQVQSAHLMGEGVCPHWWAILRPRDEVRV